MSEELKFGLLMLATVPAGLLMNPIADRWGIGAGLLFMAAFCFGGATWVTA